MNNKKLKNMSLTALFTAIIIICSLITVPSAIPFTLQTFAIFLSLNTLGGKNGLLSVFLYIFAGVIGLPVFSGFQGGLGALFNVTGGFIFGFIAAALIYWLITSLFSKKPRKTTKIIASFSGLLLCYIFGTTWYILTFLKNGDAISITTALTVCVLPFIIPDILKILLSVAISEKLKIHTKIQRL